MSAFAVPYTNFAAKNEPIRQALIASFEQVLDSGHYILGPEVRAFEEEFARYLNVPFATGMSNGTCALHIAFRCLNLEPDAEIITAPNSFIASASTIALAGAKPVFVDVADDLNIDVEQIETAITPRTKAIVPVHLAGRPARMPEIMALAERHGLMVLEDAAQAVGASIDGRRVGAWGDAACFSLHPLKNLHAFGDAGMFVTRDADLLDRVALTKNHGLRNRDTCESWGFNCRLDELQAALLRVQMTRLDEWTTERRRLAHRYNELLGDLVGVPTEAAGEFHVFQTYVVLADQRDALQQYLRDHGVEALVHYPTPIHLQPAARALGYASDAFPNTLRLSGRIMSLPLYPGLTEQQQDLVVSLIGDFYSERTL